jgi:oxalate decarboxylase/phosphoglucose isomerase-like protein (cupin superfamily)
VRAQADSKQAGDVGYIPPSFGTDLSNCGARNVFHPYTGHHVVNTGNTTLKFVFPVDVVRLSYANLLVQILGNIQIE